MDDVRRISRVQRGRRATRLGNDGIAPWITLDRRYTTAVLDLMARMGVSTTVRDDVWIDAESGEFSVAFDRVSFQGADPELVQKYLDEWQAGLG
jgi:hypothetical protein